LLEKHKANVNYVCDKGFTALYLASSWDHPEVIAVLVAAGARLDWAHAECGFTALGVASQVGRLKAVHSLIRANADPNQVMTNELASSPLIVAAEKGHALVIDALAAAGARVDYARPMDGATALHLASQGGQLQATRSLLLAGADPRLAAHDRATALDDAKRNKHNDIVALLEARLAELAASP
jgi:ankyrin repeat protein